MALPNSIDKSTPAGSASPGLGDDQFRALKLFLQDVFGIPDATNITVSPIDIAAGGAVTINPDGADVDFIVEGDTETDLIHVDAGNDRVGIGIATPDGRLHVHTASAGAVTASVNADEIVAENSGNAGITVLSGNTSEASLKFGDDGNNAIAGLTYDNNDNTLDLIANASVIATMTASSINIRPVGAADVELEVSDASTIGAGAIHRASSGTHSMRHMKTVTKNYTPANEKKAYDDLKSLKPIRFRYRRGADPHNPGKPGVDDPTMPEHNGYNFDEVPAFIQDPNTETITIDDRIMQLEMCMKEVIRKVEAARP